MVKCKCGNKLDSNGVCTGCESKYMKFDKDTNEIRNLTEKDFQLRKCNYEWERQEYAQYDIHLFISNGELYKSYYPNRVDETIVPIDFKQSYKWNPKNRWECPDDDSVPEVYVGMPEFSKDEINSFYESIYGSDYKDILDELKSSKEMLGYFGSNDGIHNKVYSEFSKFIRKNKNCLYRIGDFNRFIKDYIDNNFSNHLCCPNCKSILDAKRYSNNGIGDFETKAVSLTCPICGHSFDCEQYNYTFSDVSSTSNNIDNIFSGSDDTFGASNFEFASRNNPFDVGKPFEMGKPFI